MIDWSASENFYLTLEVSYGKKWTVSELPNDSYLNYFTAKSIAQTAD